MALSLLFGAAAAWASLSVVTGVDTAKLLATDS